MKLAKIKLIEQPRPQVVLGIGETESILGGLVCSSYRFCDDALKSSCTSFDNGKDSFCGDDKDLSHVLCSSHASICSSYKGEATCSTYSF